MILEGCHKQPLSDWSAGGGDGDSGQDFFFFFFRFEEIVWCIKHTQTLKCLDAATGADAVNGHLTHYGA